MLFSALNYERKLYFWRIVFRFGGVVILHTKIASLRMNKKIYQEIESKARFLVAQDVDSGYFTALNLTI